MVIYPPDQQDQVFALLEDWADPAWSYAHALEIAEQEIQTLTGVNAFYAWFNKGTSLVKMEHYLEAAEAYDQAYQIYEGLVNDDTTRPYRITWYQTWPYMAYYFSGRYQDVINLADTTLNDTISEPVLEESFYWRALAREALGDLQGAIDDFRQSVILNPNFGPGKDQLARLGVEG
jgi:tetratricopeptide (TPR) repeat protein